jgi:type III pantothenate kinase
LLLVFDVGNTNTVLGVFDGERLLTHWRIRTDTQRTSDEYGILLKALFENSDLETRLINAVVISSVVPSAMLELEWMIDKYLGCKPLIIESGIKTGLAIKYDNPREVGADRVVNAVAAYHKYGGPLIIVDFGTATTFCVVNEKGEYLGGAIAPGIKVSTEALLSKAAKLPRVELITPGSVIGKNTVNSIQSGIFYGIVGQVEGIINRMVEETGIPVTVVATGGLASIIASETKTIDIIDEFLTLEGLRIIFEINRRYI